MNTSIFEVAGPVMIGPSSSHTAGAARLAYVARILAAGRFSRVSFGLHGSFAKTYKGHGTDRALVAGVLGIREDDEALASSFELAKETGLVYDFHEIELHNAHENSVKITFFMDNGEKCEVTGSSVGGGQILISRLNDMSMEFSAQLPTLFVLHPDRKGTLSEITKSLALHGVNIAVMKLGRESRGGNAYCVIEADDSISGDIVAEIKGIPGVIDARAINITEAGGHV